MAEFRPEKKEGGGNWLGFKQGKILEIKDRSDEFDWADVYLQVDFEVEGSKYPRVMTIAGSYDRTDDGEDIVDCRLVKRLYWFLDTIRSGIHINLKGEFERDNDETIVTDLPKYLMEKGMIGNGLIPSESEYELYVYREPPKDNGKIYTRVYPRVSRRTPTELTDFKSYINYLLDKGFLKTYNGEEVVSNNSDNLSGVSQDGLDQL